MTARTTGVPYHPGPDEPVYEVTDSPRRRRRGEPAVTKVVFETTGTPNAEAADLYARRFLARTVGHLDAVDVEALVDSALRARPDFHDLDYHELGKQRLLTTALVETVLDQARATLRTRLAIDIATSLLPRLKGSS